MSLAPAHSLLCMMTQRDEFRVVERPDRPYVAVTGQVTMQTIPEIADRYGEVFDWLAEQGVQPAGAPFFRYLVIDMDRSLVMQAGVPVQPPVEGSGTIEASVLPGGRYATTTYTGHPAKLVEVTRRMLEWAEDQGLQWDVKPSDDGE